jgi:hypothetical protein
MVIKSYFKPSVLVASIFKVTSLIHCLHLYVFRGGFLVGHHSLHFQISKLCNLHASLVITVLVIKGLPNH